MKDNTQKLKWFYNLNNYKFIQTLNGKGPFGVAERAKQKGIPVIGIAGKVPLEKNESLYQYFDVLLSVGNEPSDLTAALKTSKQNIIRTAREIGNLLSLKDHGN